MNRPSTQRERDKKQVENDRKTVHGDKGVGVDKHVLALLEDLPEDSADDVEGVAGMVDWMHAAARHIKRLESTLEDVRELGKDRLWKCANLSCGHVFESDHDICPRCYR